MKDSPEELYRAVKNAAREAMFKADSALERNSCFFTNAANQASLLMAAEELFKKLLLESGLIHKSYFEPPVLIRFDVDCPNKQRFTISRYLTSDNFNYGFSEMQKTINEKLRKEGII